jgi:hypothetical protein
MGEDEPKERANTQPGFAPLEKPAARSSDTDVDLLPPKLAGEEDPAPGEGSRPKPLGRPSEPPPPKKRRGTPVLEVEVVHEHGPAPSTDRPWRTVEIWTRNRIYTLDSIMQCIEVMDRASREVVSDHPFLGMRLVGGQHREGERIELSYPFPRPGTEAVFELTGQSRRAGSFSRTSAVSRVVLRLHIVTVSPGYVIPTWEEITGSLLPPPPEDEED